MSIQPIAGVLSGLTPTAAAEALGGAAGTPGTAGVPGADAAFGATFAGAIDNLQAMQSKTSALAVQAVTGDLDDVHDYTIASSEAAVALELTAAVRNKAVDAFTEIMRMQA